MRTRDYEISCLKTSTKYILVHHLHFLTVPNQEDYLSEGITKVLYHKVFILQILAELCGI